MQEPLTSWGALISEGAKVIEVATWMLVYPAIFLALTLFCFNFIGDGLRDALDPKDRQEALDVTRTHVLTVEALRVRFQTPDGEVPLSTT